MVPYVFLETPRTYPKSLIVFESWVSIVCCFFFNYKADLVLVISRGNCETGTIFLVDWTKETDCLKRDSLKFSCYKIESSGFLFIGQVVEFFSLYYIIFI